MSSFTIALVTLPIHFTLFAWQVYIWGGGIANPRKLDLFKDAKSAAQIACSKNHYAVITVEKELYTWTVSKT